MKTTDEAFRRYKFTQQRLSLWNAIELHILLCKIIDQQILQQIRLKKSSLSPQCNNEIKVSWHFTEMSWQRGFYHFYRRCTNASSHHETIRKLFFAYPHISQVCRSVSHVHATIRTILYNFGAAANICDVWTIFMSKGFSYLFNKCYKT